MSKHIITLKHPIELKGTTIGALELRRPKGRDLEALEARKGTSTTKSFLFIADLAGVDPDMIRELDPEDLETINDWLGPILDPKGRRSNVDGS